MKTELFTVSKIFTETLYRIPDYQRGYSWGIDQLRDFWLDIDQLNLESRHYIGVLTLEEVPEEKWKKWEDDIWIIKSKHFKPYYVVDGQQRLTTIVILLQVILEKDSLRQLNYTGINDVKRKYIFDSKPEESSRSYIFGYEKDNPSYEHLKTRIFLEQSEKHHPQEDTIYTKNLSFAKKYFEEKIKDMPVETIDIIFTKLTQGFVFNAYEISSDIDVFVTFETMNNRGKPLTTLELLKNRLIFLSTKLPAPEGEENRLRRIINDAWKSAYHYLGKNETRVIEDDDFLRTFMTYYYLTKIHKIQETDDGDSLINKRRFELNIDGLNRFLLNELFTQKRMVEIEKKDITLPPLTRDFIFDFAKKLKQSVELYYCITTPDVDHYSEREIITLERLGRLRDFGPSSILFSIYMIEKNEKKRYKLIEIIEKYQFIISISGPMYEIRSRRKIRYDKTMQYTTGTLSSDQLLEIYKESINACLKESSLADMLNDWVRNGQGFYGWRFIRFFLYEYEVHLQSKSKTEREKIEWHVFNNEKYEDEYFTIEHIYPQKARDKYWTERFSKYSPNQKKLLRNSLGNLLALSKPKNSSLGNKPFPEKRDASTNGYRYGSYSENEVASIDDWTAKEILKRGMTLLDFLEERWGIAIGSAEQKKHALGLDFIK